MKNFSKTVITLSAVLVLIMGICLIALGVAALFYAESLLRILAIAAGAAVLLLGVFLVFAMLFSLILKSQG